MDVEPIVSVILPVYNAGSYLKASVESILEQSYNDFEFIIINDGSTDDSEKIIQSFRDPRIIYIRQQNQGLAQTLNNGLALAKGKYIARQDQDDISYPDRLKKQVDFLDTHPEVSLLGTQARIISEGPLNNTYHKHPSLASVIKFDLLFDNPFVHSSVMLRKSIIDEVGNYHTEKGYYEDFHLWSRISRVSLCTNLKEVLIDYRHHEKGMSKNFAYYSDNLYNQSLVNLQLFIGETSTVINDLAAVYHLKVKHYAGSDISALSEVLNRIAGKLINEFPKDKHVINSRKENYLSIIKYRSNELRSMDPSLSKFKRYYFKIVNRLSNNTPIIDNKYLN